MKPFNWAADETEIHTYLLEGFDNLGYDCINFHKSGACVEGGIDIFSNNGNDSVAIAVKIKPQKNDIKQLKKFALSESKRKMYIYIKDPTKPFFDELKKFKKSHRIEVFNAKLLHNFLIKNKSTHYIKKFIYSHEVFVNLTRIMKKWCSVKENKPLSAGYDDLNLLWDWKDKTVSFHKTAKIISNYMKQKIKDISSDDDEVYTSVMNEVIMFLNYINYEVAELDSIFETVKRKNSNLLAYMWKICRSRSNWCTLLGRLESQEKKEVIEQIFFKWYFHDLSDSPYTLLYNILENMEQVGDNFETAVDWMFRDINRKITT